MAVDAFKPFSGDSHLEIPPDMWTHRIATKYQDRAPRRIRLPEGGDAIVGENSPIVYGGTGHYSGHTPEDFNPMVPDDYDETVGAGSAEQRLREQDADGIAGELLFPSNSIHSNSRTALIGPRWHNVRQLRGSLTHRRSRVSSLMTRSSSCAPQ